MSELDIVKSLAEIAAGYGLPGFVFLIWYLDHRKFQDILARYKADVSEVRGMYESNVRLVQRYAEVSEDLRELVQLNTRVWQQTVDAIKTNQYCPSVRLKKDAPGPVINGGEG